eukprot:65631_1
MRGVVGHLSMRNLIQNGPCSAVNGNRRSSSIGMITKKLRMYSSIAPPSMYVFDRASKKIQRDMAAKNDQDGRYDYLRRHCADALVDRIEDIKRTFPVALDLGCHAGIVHELLAEKEGLGRTGGIGGVETLVQCDTSPSALERAKRNEEQLPKECRQRIKTTFIEADEEALPFEPESFDLILSNLSLHWVNNLPGTLKQIERLLKPDGVYMATMLGGSTLTELRACMLLAGTEREGGMSVHTSPMAEVSDCGNLLLQAGFQLPTVDQDMLQVSYPNALVLMEHLQRMGEGNSSIERRLHVSRNTLLAAAALYQARYGDDDGGVTATFQVINMIGWKYDSSKPVIPKKRGSAALSFKDI